MSTIHNFCGQDLEAMPSLEEAGVIEVPLRRATSESLRGLGRIITDLESADVAIVPWPTQGWRTLVPGTGIEGGTVRGSFVMERRGGLLFATNHAVERSYITGWYEDPATASETREPLDTRVVYTHEANYHPDGGQAFVPADGQPFVALLAPPGDDVRAEDFTALWCDGTFGIHIDPGVWHQPLFPTGDRCVFDDEQGKVHACVSVDFLRELGGYLAVRLDPPMHG